jgi:hypothetical protein
VLGKKHTVSRDCPNHDCNDAGYAALKDGRSLALASDLGFGVGVAGLVLGGVLWLTGPASQPAHGTRAWQPVLFANGGSCGGGLSGRF